MKDQHNSDKTSTYLQHLDANNLYEGVIIQKLSTCIFLGRRNSIILPMRESMI